MTYAPDWMTTGHRGSSVANQPSPRAANENSGQDAVARLRAARSGTRNDTLYAVSFQLGKAEVASGLQLISEKNALWDTAIQIGLSERETNKTMQSAFDTARRGAASNSVANGAQEALPPLEASSYQPIDPRTIPKREFLFGKHYIRKYVSATAAPGGVGKSALTVLEAVLMASGRSFDQTQPNKAALRVWIYNLEDPIEELQRRIEAVRLAYGIEPGELEGNLFVNSGRDRELIIAAQHKGGLMVTAARDELIDEIKRRKIDVLLIDPFVSCHRVQENDNGAVDLVVKQFGKIAEATKASIELIHHTRKEIEAGLSADSIRGGKAFTDGIRHARVLESMPEAVAEDYSIANPSDHFGVKAVKSNLSRSLAGYDWFEMTSQALGNGDSIGVPMKRHHHIQRLAHSEQELDQICLELSRNDMREHPEARDWAGVAVAEVMNIDFGKGKKQSQRSPRQKANRKKIKHLLEVLVDDGTLEVDTRHMNGRQINYLVPVTGQNGANDETGAEGAEIREVYDTDP